MYTTLAFAKYSSTHHHSRSGEPCTGGHGEILADATPQESIDAFCSECRAYVPMHLAHIVPVSIGAP